MTQMKGFFYGGKCGSYQVYSSAYCLPGGRLVQVTVAESVNQGSRGGVNRLGAWGMAGVLISEKSCKFLRG